MTLHDVLGDDLYAQVESAINSHNAAETNKAKHVRFVDLSEGQYVSKGRYDDQMTALNQQVTDLQGQIAQRDADMAGINEQLTAAQADASKLADAQASLTSLQSRYETDRQNWESKVSQQAYEFAVRERANGLQFSSASAKKTFVADAISKGFKMDGDTLMGYEDFVTQYRANDPGAFATEKAPEAEPAPTIVLPSGTGSAPAGKNAFGFHFNGVRPQPKE
jgi:hypothetical protein